MQGMLDKTFVEPFRRLAAHFESVWPSLITVLVILIIGGAVAVTLRWMVFRLLTRAKFDRLVDTTGFGSAILRTQLFRSPSDFAARIVQGVCWAFIVLFALVAVEAPVANSLVDRFVNYIPAMLTAGLVLLLASAVSKFLARSALLAAVNAQWPGARLLAGSVRVLVMTLGVLVALEQLRIGLTPLLVTFAILFAGIVVAGAIAFGYGARDMARQWLQERMKPPTQEEEPFHHL